MADDSPENMKTLISLGSVIAALLAIFVDPFWHVDLPPVRGTPSVEWTPRTFPQCFIVLEKELPADTLERMRTISEADMGEYHFGLGTWMRDSWGLWSGGPLYSYFRQIGLVHPDDMSGVILTSFWRHLHGKRLDVEGQVRKYQLYWRYNEHPDPLSNPQCATGVETVLSLGTSAAGDVSQAVHMGKCCLDGQVWSYGADRGWYRPDASQMAVWNQDRDRRYDPCRKPASPYDE
jgi:hypothetical protein